MKQPRGLHVSLPPMHMDRLATMAAEAEVTRSELIRVWISRAWNERREWNEAETIRLHGPAPVADDSTLTKDGPPLAAPFSEDEWWDFTADLPGFGKVE